MQQCQATMSLIGDLGRQLSALMAVDPAKTSQLDVMKMVMTTQMLKSWIDAYAAYGPACDQLTLRSVKAQLSMMVIGWFKRCQAYHARPPPSHAPHAAYMLQIAQQVHQHLRA